MLLAARPFVETKRRVSQLTDRLLGQRHSTQHYADDTTSYLTQTAVPIYLFVGVPGAVEKPYLVLSNFSSYCLEQA